MRENAAINVNHNKPSSRDASDKHEHSYKRHSVLVVDDEPGIRSFLVKGLESRFGLIEVADNAEAAETLRQRCHFDLIIADIRLPGRSGVDWVTELREQGSHTAVIFITAHANLETAVAALRAGADDFIMKPFRMNQMLASIDRCMERLQLVRENVVLRRQVNAYFDSTGIIGDCDLIKSVCQLIKQVAVSTSTVLIEGETGTGKELAARAIHVWSGRNGSFVPLNCAAMSAELLESELFGHTKGAFTGAQQAREGMFTFANDGTLFLDEIGEMPLPMQAHLLRVLEERTIRPVGSNRQIPVDVRVLAATNRNLAEEVEKGNFRADLYYRLNVVSVRIPALRERLEDLPVLVQHFANSLSSDMGLQPPVISEAEINALRAYDWPGNIRELKNVIERCLLLNKTPSKCMLAHQHPVMTAAVIDDDVQLETIEKRHILQVLEDEGGNKSAAARRLGISRKTLERKVQAWRANG